MTTDNEILRSVGLGMMLDKPDHKPDHILIGKRVLRAMKKARDDERVQAASDVQIACMNGELPDVCEEAGNFIVRAVGSNVKLRGREEKL